MPSLISTVPSTVNESLSVSDLNRRARELLENGFPLLWVSGEITNLSYAASGHVYFSLKDSAAQVRCVMFRSRAQVLGWRLENGQQVEVRALVTLYEARGEFQLSIETVRRAGQGDLFQRFLQLKTRLEAEGLFAASAKRPLPVFPRRIGIVTSPQAAALQDVVTTLRRRSPQIRLTLYPTPVQGESAAPRIAAALLRAGQDGNDLVLLCRGGGSLEDLWAFNEEIVARALHASPVPVICGVGHETDFTIADFAADLRAPTPTAAAELAAPERLALLTRLDQLAEQLLDRTLRHWRDTSQRIDGLAGRLIHPATRIVQQRQTLTHLATQLQQSLRHAGEQRQYRLQLAARRHHGARPQITPARQRLTNLQLRFEQATREIVHQQERKLISLGTSLRQLDPHGVLGRGYALARNASGTLIRDAAQLSVGQTLQLAFAHGTAHATVLSANTDEAVPKIPSTTR